MVKTPVLLSLLLLALGAVVTSLLFAYETTLELSGADLVSNLVQIWVAVAALVSVVFVVYSYLQTNRAFRASQEPHLLIQLRSTIQVPNDQTPADQGIHWTGISYQNITDNAFNDLMIRVSVTDGQHEACLDDLFRGPMFMAGRDSRTRSFTTAAHLRARGLDLEEALASEREVSLRIGYDFTFLGAAEHVDAQEYVWDVGQPGWQIR